MGKITNWPRYEEFGNVLNVNDESLRRMAWIVPCAKCGKEIVGPRRDSVPEKDEPLMQTLVCIQCTYGVEHITPELLELVVGHPLSDASMDREKYAEAKKTMVESGILPEADFYIMIAKLIGYGMDVEVPEEDRLNIIKAVVTILERQQKESDQGADEG